MSHQIIQTTTCFHCGENCGKHPFFLEEKAFCCQGCLLVYDILHKNGLCNYYDLEKYPGTAQKFAVRKNKFSYLDDEKISSSLITFANQSQTHITFYLPQIHCSSCLWLLENLHRINLHVISSKVNFGRKEVDIVFENQKISLRQIAELLISVGYEPYISFSDLKKVKPTIDKSKTYKLGVAGFCFANIMLLSFPEYLGINLSESSLLYTFRYLSLILSLPVVLYSATEFYNTAWKSLKHRFLSIDAPIVLAIWVTFGRSVYEIISGTGGGYFDSMSGIVFFMLIGRTLQEKTYARLNFDRDYTSYFPVAVTRLAKGGEELVTLPEIKFNDTLLIHNSELIPADGILTSGYAVIDYSFVTGESMPVFKEMGEIVYAGGKQTGSNIEILVIKEIEQSYLTKLWNRDTVAADTDREKRSFVHLVSQYFTWIVFGVAALAALYWAYADSSKILTSVTAVLIIACPCALLLSNTFTNGNILRLLSHNKFYLRNAQTIEKLAGINHVVFDKTGTLTTGEYLDIEYVGKPLSAIQKNKIAALASQSMHPLSRGIAKYLSDTDVKRVIGFSETTGKGIEGIVDGDLIGLGSKSFVNPGSNHDEASAVYVSIEEKVIGKFVFCNRYRDHIPEMIYKLQKQYPVSVISGDSEGEKYYLKSLLGKDAQVLFNQSPADKLEVIKTLQAMGKNVLMLGDGLNDAGALKQADVGIAVSDNTNNFTPASDAIIDASRLVGLHKFIRLCRMNKPVVLFSFMISVLYNLVGLYFAVQGNLSPMIAAILMPASSLTILLVTFGSGNLIAWKLGLQK
ncbi:MAG: heavy metal translocating P-type ATPase metal-binding domain-containing protein [Chitinophagaceae bacterium]|nr:heavy metal translocating P-type ATPase metal-binding domain-containing protein [Chitinophagaceae bacterium]